MSTTGLDGPFEIAGTVRVERAKPYRRATATTELLSDQRTAEHYRAGAPDALGRRITLGSPMTYVDWRNPNDVVWRVYEWRTDDADHRKKWVPVGDFASRDEAIIDATARAAVGGKA